MTQDCRRRKDTVIEKIENFGYQGKGKNTREGIDGEDVFDIAVSAVDAGRKTDDEVQRAVNKVLRYPESESITEVETGLILQVDERTNYDRGLSSQVSLEEEITYTRARIERDYTGEDLSSYLEDDLESSRS